MSRLMSHMSAMVGASEPHNPAQRPSTVPDRPHFHACQTNVRKIEISLLFQLPLAKESTTHEMPPESIHITCNNLHTGLDVSVSVPITAGLPVTAIKAAIASASGVSVGTLCLVTGKAVRTLKDGHTLSRTSVMGDTLLGFKPLKAV